MPIKKEPPGPFSVDRTPMMYFYLKIRDADGNDIELIECNDCRHLSRREFMSFSDGRVLCQPCREAELRFRDDD